ncbi:Uncharacterised protein [Vibrio cholerae]|nr:Uncharacterised protein [Vibrio cholerae]
MPQRVSVSVPVARKFVVQYVVTKSEFQLLLFIV